MDAYDELLRNPSVTARNYAASMFNSTTWRMFKKGESKKIKEFLIRHIGDGRRLARCRGQREYDAKLARLILRFCDSFHMNSKMKHRRPGFGHASKVINLYVKHLLLVPEYLRPYKMRSLESHAHVPLDKWVLRRIWGYKKKRGDFRDKLENSLRHRPPTLNTLEEDDYRLIQRALANAPRKKPIPTIAYDYFYAVRPE